MVHFMLNNTIDNTILHNNYLYLFCKRICNLNLILIEIVIKILYFKI